MLIASPVNDPSVAALGCGALCVGVALALCVGVAVAPGFEVGFDVGFEVGLALACFVGFAAVLLLGATLASACGTPPAIDVVLDKFGGLMVNTAPNPPIVPPTINKALFIS